jgi:hypothetical protein
MKIFEENKVRTLWDEENEKWYLAIVDVIAALINWLQVRSRGYKIMKRIPIFFLFLLLIGQIKGQNIVIDHPVLGGFTIPFEDTIISSYNESGCTTSNYYVDLDWDSNHDIRFYLTCYMGGIGNGYEMTLFTLNNFSIHVDTTYFEHFQFIDTSGIVNDSIRRSSVVKKYNSGDPIYNHQNILSSEEKLLYYSSGNYPPCVYNNINLFFQDTSYIAFENSTGNLYYLKIFVSSKSSIHLFSAKSNVQGVFINEQKFEQNYIFPNPATEIIYLKEDFDMVAIYSIQGTLLVKENFFGARDYMNISTLPKGIYLVRLTKNESTYLSKLVKL